MLVYCDGMIASLLPLCKTLYSPVNSAFLEGGPRASIIEPSRSAFCSNLVDPASNHMLIWKIKPCMSKYNRWNIFWTKRPQKAHYISVIRFDGLGHWITVAILVLIHAFINLYIFRFVQFVIIRFLSVCQAKFTNFVSKQNL